MTETKEEVYSRLCDRDENKCQHCGEPIPKGKGQFAHLIGQGVRNRRFYGDYIIDHENNKRLTDTLECNGYLDISNDLIKVIHVLVDIADNPYVIRDYLIKLINEEQGIELQ